MSDYLSPNETQPCQPGSVVVNVGAGQWKTLANAPTNYGALIGVNVLLTLPGNPIQVVTEGRVPWSIFNLGAGNAQTVVIGTVPSRNSSPGTAQVIGTCGPDGEVFVQQSYLGEPAHGIVDSLFGIQANSTAPTTGQVPEFDGTRITWSTASAAVGGAVTGSGFWHSTSGVLDAAASHGAANQIAFGGASDISWAAPTGDVTALSGTAFTVGKINGSSVPAGGALTTGNVLQVNGVSSLTYAPVNLAGGAGYVTGTLPAGNIPSLLGDVTGLVSATTVGKLLNISIPAYPLSAGSYVLVYAEGTTSYSWVLTSSIGGGFSVGGDLTGSSSVQYVTTISGSSGAGGAVKLSANAFITAAASSQSYIDLTGANASYGYGKFLNFVYAPSFDAATVTNVGFGNTNAVGITIGNATNGLSTIVVGHPLELFTQATQFANFNLNNADYLYIGAANSQAQYLATGITFQKAVATPKIQQSAPTSDVATTTLSILSQSAYASASTNKAAGSLILDSGVPVSGAIAIVSLGGANATTISVGNTTTTKIITFNITGAVGGGVAAYAGSNNILLLNSGASDQISFGSGPAISNGYVRIPVGSSAQNIVSSGFATNTVLFGTNAAGGTFLNSFTAGVGVFLQDGGVNVVQANISSSNPQLLLNSGSTSGASNGGVIGWPAVNASGAGMPLGVFSQGAKTGSNANSGTVVICSGALDGSGLDGGIQFGFNTNTGSSATDKVTFLGANTSAARGTLQYSKAITPAFTQTAIGGTGTTNGANWTWTAQQGQPVSSGSNNSGGSFIFIPGPTGTGGTGGTGHYGFVAIQTASGPTNMITMGDYALVTGNAAGTYGAFWFATNSPTGSNFSFLGSTSQTTINSPSGGNTYLSVNNAPSLGVSASEIICYMPLGGDGSTNNARFNAPNSISIGVGGTTSPSAGTFATGPLLILTSTSTTTSQVILDFGSATAQSGSFWVVDTAGITFGASLGISVKNGSSTVSVTTIGAPTGNSFWVFLDGTANRILFR